MSSEIVLDEENPTPSEAAEPASKHSSRVAEVVPVVLEKHPDADRLSVVRVYGFTCVTATDQWQGVKTAVYIQPDTLVDVTRPEFDFLIKDANKDFKARIRAKKLRGVLSFGLLVPAPEGAKVGDDLWEVLGLEHYEPPMTGNRKSQGGVSGSGEVAPAPNVYHVKYDLEAGRRWSEKVFVPGEPCVISEKAHGANSRYVYTTDGVMHCGSRTEWKKEYPSEPTIDKEELVKRVGQERADEIEIKMKSRPLVRNMWWQALDATPSLREFCQANPDCIVYGEVYGAVQDLSYGCKAGEVRFAAFDIMKDGRWLDSEEAWSLAPNIPWVPYLTKSMPYDFEAICEMAEGKTTFPGADHVREGVVVKPVKERRDHLGRACLKWVGAGYHARG